MSRLCILYLMLVMSAGLISFTCSAPLPADPVADTSAKAQPAGEATSRTHHKKHGFGGGFGGAGLYGGGLYGGGLGYPSLGYGFGVPSYGLGGFGYPSFPSYPLYGGFGYPSLGYGYGLGGYGLGGGYGFPSYGGFGY